MKKHIVVGLVVWGLMAGGAYAAVSAITTNSAGKWVGGTQALRTNWNELVRMIDAGEIGETNSAVWIASNSNLVAGAVQDSDPTSTIQIDGNVYFPDLVTGDAGIRVSDSSLASPLGTSVINKNYADARYLYAAGTTNKTLIDAAIDSPEKRAYYSSEENTRYLTSQAEYKASLLSKALEGMASAATATNEYVKIPYRHNRSTYLASSATAMWRARGGRVLLGTVNGLEESYDNGKTRTLIDPLPTPYVSTPRMVRETSTGDIYWSPVGSGYLRRSQDGGETWENNLFYLYDASHTNDARSIWGFDEAPNGDLYAGTYELSEPRYARVYKSTDSGDSWSLFYSNTNEYHVHGIKVNPYNSDVWVATGDNEKSVIRFPANGGAYETNSLTGVLADNQCISIEFMPGKVFVGDDYIGNIHMSEDNGATWNLVYQSMPNDSCTSFSSWKYNDRVYYGMAAHNADSHGRIVSTEDGSTWEMEYLGPNRELWSGALYASRVTADGLCNVYFGETLDSVAKKWYYLFDCDKTKTFGGVGQYGVNLFSNALLTASGTAPSGWAVESDAGVTALTSHGDCSYFKDSTYWRFQCTTATDVESNSYSLVYDETNIAVTNGQEMTVSVFLKGDITYASTKFGFEVYNSSDVLLDTDEYNILFHPSDEYERYSYTYTVADATASYIKPFIKCGQIRDDSAVDLYIALPQIESGNGYSPFCPMEPETNPTINKSVAITDNGALLYNESVTDGIFPAIWSNAVPYLQGNGSDSYISVESNPASNKTYAVLVKFDALTTNEPIMGHNDSNDLDYDNIVLRESSTRLMFRGGGAVETQSTVYMPASYSNSWQWLVFRKDFTNNMFYIDGVGMNQEDDVSSYPFTRETSITRVGYTDYTGIATGSSPYGFSKFIEWNRVLSEDEVGSFLADPTSAPTGYVQYLTMEESSGTNAYNVAQDGAVAGIVNGTWTNSADLIDQSWSIEVGCQVWTNGSNYVYVPVNIDGDPATNSVSGYALEKQYPLNGYGEIRINADLIFGDYGRIFVENGVLKVTQ